MSDGDKRLHRLYSLRDRVDTLTSTINKAGSLLDNKMKRKFYCTNELLETECQECRSLFASDTGDEAISAILKEAQRNIEQNRALLKLDGANLSHLNPIQKFSLIVEVAFRAIAAGLWLLACSIVLAIPCILIKPLDRFLTRRGILPARNQLSLLVKRAIAYGIITCMGINMRVEGVDAVLADIHETSIMCFSHTCALDAFLFAAALPVRAHAIGKAELFMIPFFSWLGVANDGIAIDRKNRDNAVKAIHYATDSASGGEIIFISPEGTRSTSGQLLPFKKGVFHMWEEMKCPIIPLMYFGAYELYPSGWFIPIPGTVVLKCLPPILPRQAASRDDMMLLLRQQMLQSAARDVPSDIAQPLALDEWLLSLMVAMGVYSVYYLFFTLYVPFLLRKYQLTMLQLTVWFLVATVVITAVLYVYAVIIRTRLHSHQGKSKGRSTTKSASASADGKVPATKETATATAAGAGNEASAAHNDNSKKKKKWKGEIIQHEPLRVLGGFVEGPSHYG